MNSLIQWIIKTLLGNYLKQGATLGFLQGYRTIVFAVGGIVVAIIGYLGGANVGGIVIPALSPDQAAGAVWIALMAIFAAVHKPKTPNPVPPPQVNQAGG